MVLWIPRASSTPPYRDQYEVIFDIFVPFGSPRSPLLKGAKTVQKQVCTDPHTGVLLPHPLQPTQVSQLLTKLFPVITFIFVFLEIPFLTILRRSVWFTDRFASLRASNPLFGQRKRFGIDHFTEGWSWPFPPKILTCRFFSAFFYSRYFYFSHSSS